MARLYRPIAALRLCLRLFGDGVMGGIVSVSSGLFGDGVMGGIVSVLSGEYSLFVCMFASNLRSVFSHLMRKCRY